MNNRTIRYVFFAAVGLVGFYVWAAVTGLVNFYDDVIHVENNFAELLITVAATLVAAWAGGAAAFGVERETQMLHRRNEEISAANRAIFKVSQIYTILDNLRQHMIDPARKKPDRATSMDSPQPGMLPAITFNFDELSLLLGQRGDPPQRLNELMILEWKYRVLLTTVEHRASTREAYARADPLAFPKLVNLTDQMVESVDDGLAEIRKVYDPLLKTFEELFPGQHFVKIDFGAPQARG